MSTGETPFDVIQSFIAQLNGVDDHAGLHHLMDGITVALGYRHFAIIHHDNLRKSVPGLINLHSYPDVWADYFIERRLASPRLRSGRQASTATAIPRSA